MQNFLNNFHAVITHEDVTIYMILNLVLGLALFLFGMDVMGEGLKKSAGNKLKTILGKMTSNKFKGFLLGLGVTLIIQSSSATTVMVVGFVNSATMTLAQAVGVILGANVGTAITAWLTAMTGMEMAGAEGIMSGLQYLKPDFWMPILALIGIGFTMFAKKNRYKQLGNILLGFGVLMTGMNVMSEAVSVLKNIPEFGQILVMFENPFLGVLAGTVLTAIVQSSSASVGILQALTASGAISFGVAIPIVMGQNIGTCVTAMLSSMSSSKNGKRAALVHLYFNIIAVTIVLSGFYILDAIFDFSALLGATTNMWHIAIIHTVFKLIAVTILFPFTNWIVKLATISVPEKSKKKKDEDGIVLDERLFITPAVAVEQAEVAARKMAVVSCDAMDRALMLLSNYDSKSADLVRKYEDDVDKMEDTIGSYLVKLAAKNSSGEGSREITKLLHIIGDLERISDHAVNIAESAEEMKDKNVQFSAAAQKEINTMVAAVREVLWNAREGFINDDFDIAASVEPLEEVIDDLRDAIKLHHIVRLQNNECTMEMGFILSDLLTNCERVADHCSNIAGCMLELSEEKALDMHKYLYDLKHGNPEFDRRYQEYKEKYPIEG
ncbi:MAG: Na/Pi cotransporter family protein [Clostridia bacterium]|nr:Na/Pi cotransporter family protein [Clostridia bacterium]MBQ7380375.1 Na/Pi cotransporter family protein [Clostridia bacterium]